MNLATGLLGSVVALVSFAYHPVGIVGGDADAGVRHGSAVSRLSDLGGACSMPRIGTLIAHLIGWRLIPLNFNQQRYESRFPLRHRARGRSFRAGRADAGRAVERAELQHRFWQSGGQLDARWWRRQTRLVGFVGGYAQASTVVPVLIVSPAYLAGAIPLGSLMQAALAFHRVEGAFAFCICAYGKIAEWKAMLDRLAQFEDAMTAVDAEPRAGAGHRRRARHPTREPGMSTTLDAAAGRLSRSRACRICRSRPAIAC